VNDILIAGLSRGMAATIERHFDGVAVHFAETGGQVLERRGHATSSFSITACPVSRRPRS
jgi:hypothetical protein